jgi:protoheme IX farnesyltransferase
MKVLLSLTKFVLSFAVSLSALFAYIMAKGDVDWRMVEVTAAVLLVAMGVSTLNQVQEFHSDAQMPRTRHRPIASGRISPFGGIAIAAVLVVIALWLIYDLVGMIGVDLFLFALLWYNGVYTPLKKRSAFAVIPGALLGVIPPAVGWLAGGERLFTLEFVALAIFYFVWQVPHFWLLVMLYHQDYDKGGYPTAMKVFGKVSLQHITFIWLMLTVNIGIFLVWVFDPYSKVILSLLIAVGVWGIVASFPLLKQDFRLPDAKRVFWHINLSFWSVSILLAIDAYFSHHVV